MAARGRAARRRCFPVYSRAVRLTVARLLLVALLAGSLAATSATAGSTATSGARDVAAHAAKKRRRICDRNYSGRCLRPNVSDYDCAGGSGNGPYYVRGPFYVVGYDHYRLDSDGDGVACES